MTAPSVPSRLTPWSFLRAWLLTGIRSWGGGPATLLLVHQTFVEQHGWITDDQFTRMWSLCQLAPGINLVAFTILIGRRLLGWRGVILALVGLLLPSVAVTVLITATYAGVERSPAVRAALRGVIPATVGLGLVAAWNMARPPLTASVRDGRMSAVVAFVLLAASALVIACWRTAVFQTLLAAGALGAVYHWLWQRRHAQEDGE